MSEAGPKIRLYLDAPLKPGDTVELDKGQSHYVGTVMRRRPGDGLRVFNGRSGEWLAKVVTIGKRATTLRIDRQCGPQVDPCDLWLLFAPVKKARTDLIVEKAAELGAARLVPVLTHHTNAERVRTDRLRAHLIEAAEQSGATHVAQIDDPVRLEALLRDWPTGRGLLFCDESGAAPAIGDTLNRQSPGPWAILIGPEGGFARAEMTTLRQHEACVPVSLGPRILRAETAAIAAMSAWQMTLGDWR